MSEKKFDAELSGVDGKVRLYLPFDPNDVWGKKRRHQVAGTIGGHPFEGSIGVRGGKFFVVLNAAMRAKTKLGAGDEVAVKLRSIEGASGPEVPADLTKALAASKKARAFFDSLSAFYKNTWVSWIESAKKAETRADRVAKTVEHLEAGVKQR
jgi:hypothetical protein